MDSWDLYDRAYKSAEHYALQTEFVESFVKHRLEGCTLEQAVFSALYDWDIVLILENQTPKKEETIVGNNFKRKLTGAWKKHRKEIKRLRDAGTAWYKIEQYLTLKEGKQVLSGSTIRRYFAEEFEVKEKVAKATTKVKDTVKKEFDNCGDDTEKPKSTDKVIETLKSVFPNGALKEAPSGIVGAIKEVVEKRVDRGPGYPDRGPGSEAHKQYLEIQKNYWMKKAKSIEALAKWAESGQELTPTLRLQLLELFMRHG